MRIIIYGKHGKCQISRVIYISCFFFFFGMQMWHLPSLPYNYSSVFTHSQYICKEHICAKIIISSSACHYNKPECLVIFHLQDTYLFSLSNISLVSTLILSSSMEVFPLISSNSVFNLNSYSDLYCSLTLMYFS